MTLPSSATLRNLGNALLGLALPPRCHLCRCFMAAAEPIHLCPDCRDTLPVLGTPCCSICGTPFIGAGPDHPCGACLHHPPPWERARSAFVYEAGCRDLIHAFKYRQRFQIRRPLALLTSELLTSFVSDCQPDLLLAVPLHHDRLKTRGFNQALLLAELLAAIWQLPLLRQGLQRTRNTTPQTELSAEQRVANLRNAFAVTDSGPILNKRIMLVDDVCTTGTTLSECTHSLLKGGAAAVCCLTVARAISHSADASY